MGIYNSNFDFNKYRAFYAVAECKSFSKATDLLHVSQPAISHAIKELEDQLGTKLFLRASKEVKLLVMWIKSGTFARKFSYPTQ